MGIVKPIATMYPVENEPNPIGDLQESNDVGYISLFRAIRNNWIWQDPVKFKWWVDILLEVNHKPNKALLSGSLIECGRGQSLNSLQTWAKRWRTDVSSVRRFFKLLQSDGMIRVENVQKTTRLTVCKYDSYQQKRHADDTQTTRREHADDILTTPNNNGNNDNNGNKRRKAAPFVPPTLDDVKAYFIENGYTDAAATKAFSFYDVANWVDSKGNKVKNWRQKMQSVWFRDEHKAAPTTKKQMVD